MNNEYAVVTEVGVFGNLNIDDPTAKTIKSDLTEAELEELIKNSIESNASIKL